MSKRIFCLALSLVLFLGIMGQQVTALEDPNAIASAKQTEQVKQVAPVELNEPAVAVSTGPSVFVDSVIVENANPTVYNQTTYVSLRNVVQALRPDAAVTWNDDHAAVNADNLSITVYPNAKYIQANGRYLHLPYGVMVKDGMTMVPVRVLAKALGAQVYWDSDSGNTYVSSGSGAILSADEYYNEDSLYWLSHIIYAESGNQPLDGKIGVGNVILNRLADPIFPNTIYGVIFQKNQFTPVTNGSLYLTPNDESVIAAKLCLDGAVVLPSALWFNRVGSNSWAAKNKSIVATIGAHAFYA